MKFGKIILFIAAAMAITAFISNASLADQDDGKGSEAAGKRRSWRIVENKPYKQECSSCHFLYLPGLLPEKAWEAIIKGSDKHFGENLALDQKVSAEILSYLKENSAEKRTLRWSRQIMTSVGETVPERITKVPYIVRKHRKIRAEVFKRPSIASASNCGACHPKAAEGDFEEDRVSIPKQ